mmetsp:Transcript_9090/g.17792  ORF Transcript_9090/g.17792 Transcript_9090/m.17792 type:complete len:205 (+) Transcript_9090:1314-1928(+)
MEELIFLTKASENGNCLLWSRFVHHDLLEATFQCSVLFHVLPILIKRCGTDAAKLASSKHGLQQVPSIHSRITSFSSANNRMDLVDEQDDCSIFFHFVNYGLQSLLEFTTIFCTRDELAEIQCKNFASLQSGRDISVGDTLCESFNDSCFTNTRLTNENGVILCPSRQNLDRASDFFITANYRIKFAVDGSLREVPSVFLKGLV